MDNLTIQRLNNENLTIQHVMHSQVVEPGWQQSKEREKDGTIHDDDAAAPWESGCEEQAVVEEQWSGCWLFAFTCLLLDLRPGRMRDCTPYKNAR